VSAVPAPEVAELLLAHVTGARWFGGKGRRTTVVGLTPLPWLTPRDAASAGPAVRMEVVEVAYPDDADADGHAPHHFYQLALAYRPAAQADLPADLQPAEVGRWDDPELGAVVVHDATQDPQACSVLLRSLLAQDQHRTPDAEVSFHLSAAEGLDADLEPAVFRGQQSNTSVMFGDVAMLKLFRRLELGRNLDIEVHDALSRTGMADVARLFGWAGARWTRTDAASGATETVEADLAMVVEKLAEATDGWELALDVLRRGDSFAAGSRALGRALAETHSALRQAFPTGRQPGADVAAVMRDRLGAARAAASALDPHAGALERVFDTLAATDLDVQRVHGDFHLGQTLHTPSGWKIIDFEGEPAKTLAERSAPDSVWRDIAGMLRSFGYAAASVPGPGSQAWAQQCREAFLDGYAGGPLAGADAATLRAYEADKAVYEVVYEVRNRPEWVDIPLGAVAALAAGQPDDRAGSADQGQGATHAGLHDETKE